jgi:hypothetical protein
VGLGVDGMLLLIEFCLVVVSIGVPCALPNLGARWFRRVQDLLGRLARRRGLAVLVVGLLALATRAALLPVLPVPEPGAHDEFAYLLAADTFAHGRVANPTQPMWIHFESFHINQRPTYGSMFYPAQGLVLAVGQVIGGHPFVGVWLSVGAMCAALCWMLQAWVPAGWALLGGILAVVRIGTFSYWANSYWGGTVAAIGGALVLGALPRIKRRQRVRDALLMGLGLAILANSRPYESLFFGLPVAVAVFAWMLGKKGPRLQLSLRRIVLPVGLVLVFAAAAMGYYFWRTTGSPFRTPYLVNIETYSTVPYFPWQPLRPKPVYHHLVMERYYTDGWLLAGYSSALLHPVKTALIKLIRAMQFFLGPVLTLPWAVWAVAEPRNLFCKPSTGKTGLLLAVCSVSFLGSLLPIQFTPHYAAAMTGAIYGLELMAMRHLRLCPWYGESTGRAMVCWIAAICLLLVLPRAAALLFHVPLPGTRTLIWCSQFPQNHDRARALAQLKKLDGKELVIVRYGPKHEPDKEWVYNEADIDRAKVVWARDMGREQNQELVRYFKDRQVWLVEPDNQPPTLSPYPSSRSGPALFSSGGRP